MSTTTTTKNDGGPAFPRSPHSGEPTDDGMTLLDWFAGQCIAGMLAHTRRSGTFGVYAEDAYAQAHAMLAEREKYLRPPQTEAVDPVDKEFAELSRELSELEAKMKDIPGEPCGGFAEHCSNPRHLEYHRLEGRWLVVRDLLARLHAQHPLSRKT